MRFNLKNPFEFIRKLPEAKAELKKWTEEEIEAELRMLGIPEADWPRWKEKVRKGMELDQSDPEVIKSIMQLQWMVTALMQIPREDAESILDNLEKDLGEKQGQRGKDMVFELRSMLRDTKRWKEDREG